MKYESISRIYFDVFFLKLLNLAKYLTSIYLHITNNKFIFQISFILVRLILFQFKIKLTSVLWNDHESFESTHYIIQSPFV